MNWQHLTFDWNQVRAFIATAELGSFTAAAKALEMTQPTLGRQVSLLEQKLGVVLFERKGRGLVLTPNGRELAEVAKDMAEAANRLTLTALGKSQQIAGRVSISATEDAAIFVLPPLVKKLRQVHPAIEIEIIASNTESDLLGREADIAIRGIEPTQLDLIARKLAPVSVHYYATQAYLQQIGHPTELAQLSNAHFVGYEGSKKAMIDRFASLGVNLTAKNIPFLSRNRQVHWELVKQGLCIGIFADLAAKTEPSLVKLFPNKLSLTFDNWLVVHRELRMNQRIRTVFDFLASELG